MFGKVSPLLYILKEELTGSLLQGVLLYSASVEIHRAITAAIPKPSPTYLRGDTSR